MAQGTTLIRCPYCRHPYPMTETQLNVYLGRNMGCMSCGWPFPVQRPAPPPPPPEPDPLFGVVLPTAADDPTLTGGASAASTASPASPASSADRRERAASAEVDRSPTPALWIGRAGVGLTVLMFVLTTIATIVGYAAAPLDGRPTVADTHAPLLLARLAGLAAVLAVLAGVVSLWLSRRTLSEAATPKRADTGPAIAAIGLGLFEVVAFSLLGLSVWPAVARAQGDFHKSTCQSSLKQIGNLLLSEANSRPDGRFPGSLSELVRAGKLTLDPLACPGSGVPMSDVAGDDAKAAFVYLGNGLATKPGGGKRVNTFTVLAYEKPGHHGSTEGFHVLFADATIVYVEKDQAAAMLPELQAGQNPPPSAGLVRK